MLRISPSDSLFLLFLELGSLVSDLGDSRIRRKIGGSNCCLHKHLSRAAPVRMCGALSNILLQSLCLHK